MATREYIPSTDFIGDDNHHPPTVFKTGGGQSHFRGSIVFANIARDQAKGLLATGANLDLAENKGKHKDSHPVIHLHGRHEQCSFIVNGQIYPIGNAYHEFMLLVPFVQIGGGPQFFNYVVRMYLDDAGAIYMGQFYGYRKVFAQLSMAGPDFNVTSSDPFNPFSIPQPLFSATHKMNSTVTASTLPNWPDMQAILSMPMLGVEPPSGPRHSSLFVFDFASANVNPIDCTHTYEPAFDPPFPIASSMTNANEGAVDVAGLPWQLEFPADPC